jgi:hypothetical protein
LQASLKAMDDVLSTLKREDKSQFFARPAGVVRGAPARRPEREVERSETLYTNGSTAADK